MPTNYYGVDQCSGDEQNFAKALRKTNLLGSLTDELYSAKYMYTFISRNIEKSVKGHHPGE